VVWLLFFLEFEEGHVCLWVWEQVTEDPLGPVVSDGFLAWV